MKIEEDEVDERTLAVKAGVLFCKRKDVISDRYNRRRGQRNRWWKNYRFCDRLKQIMGLKVEASIGKSGLRQLVKILKD